MCVFAAFTSTTKSTCTAGAFLVRERGVSPLADASCSAAAPLSAQLSLIYGTATKAPHIRRFTSHPRYSVAALLTTPRTSTTQPQGIISDTPQKSVGCLRMRLRLCLRVAKIRTYAKYAPSFSHLKEHYGVPVKYRSRLCARGHFMGYPCIPSLRLGVIF